jgi:hypothetical protein
VLLEIAVRGECLVAGFAFERSHPGVLPLMDRQVHLGVIPFVAAWVLANIAVLQLAYLGLLWHVRGLQVQLLTVGLQMALEFELLVAKFTSEWPSI